MRAIFCSLLAIPLFLSTGTGYAQPFPIVDISVQHDEGAGMLHVSLRANDYDFAQLISNLVFTIRWQESSAATLSFGSSAWCPAPNQALPLSPSAMVVPGNGYRYRTYNAIGFTMLGDLVDDGGCEQSLLADTWIQVYSIPINNDPGGTTYEIADDQFTHDDNRAFFISLNGQGSNNEYTGSIFTIPTAVVEEPLPAPALLLMPNPTDGPVRMSLPAGTVGPVDVEVLDAAGRITMRRVIYNNSPTIDLSDLESGNYLIRVFLADEVVTTPVVVQRP
ncbi:MAG: T9SS type A sorting domain-containing protein [Flavobacteriales bacterium]|nr:T9SS type A sorting domain-containing protein [Flavobacteriales bacterium]